jgi:hypothetical protein
MKSSVRWWHFRLRDWVLHPRNTYLMYRYWQGYAQRLDRWLDAGKRATMAMLATLQRMENEAAQKALQSHLEAEGLDDKPAGQRGCGGPR